MPHWRGNLPSCGPRREISRQGVRAILASSRAWGAAWSNATVRRILRGSRRDSVPQGGRVRERRPQGMRYPSLTTG
jgi:hypothetical protein